MVQRTLLKPLKRSSIEAYAGILAGLAASIVSVRWMHALEVVVADVIIFHLCFCGPFIWKSSSLVKLVAALVLMGLLSYPAYNFLIAPERASANAYRSFDFPAFFTIYSESPRLGKPLSNIIISPYADIERHDRSWLIFLLPLAHIIRLDDDNSAFDITDQIERPSSSSDEIERKILGLPEKCLPPTGGFAAQWERHKVDWQRIGCRVWHCHVRQNAVRYQAFENGYVIDGVPFSSGDGANATGQYFIQKARGRATWTRLATLDLDKCPEDAAIP